MYNHVSSCIIRQHHLSSWIIMYYLAWSITFDLCFNMYHVLHDIIMQHHDIIKHHQWYHQASLCIEASSCIIMFHHVSSCIIMHHHVSSWNNHVSSFIIMYHQLIIIYHHVSLFTIMYHYASSCVIIYSTISNGNIKNLSSEHIRCINYLNKPELTRSPISLVRQAAASRYFTSLYSLTSYNRRGPGTTEPISTKPMPEAVRER